jgi:RHS repeat-associated protein
VIHDYEPYGVQIPPKSSSNMAADSLPGTHLYTGQERDADTGLDNMHFRSYASTMGRFMSPDNVPGNPMDPQSFNLYAYVHGNPVTMNDPTGHMGASSLVRAVGLSEDLIGEGVFGAGSSTIDALLNCITPSFQTYTVSIKEPKGQVTALEVSVATIGGISSVSVRKASTDTTPLSASDIATMQKTTQMIYNAPDSPSVSKRMAMAVAMKESRLGKNAPNNAMQFMGKGHKSNSASKNIAQGIKTLGFWEAHAGVYEGLRGYRYGYMMNKPPYAAVATAYANDVDKILVGIFTTYRSLP